MKTRVKVVVIGAGMAGSSAAEHLFSNGICDIALLEARDRIGGRMHSVVHKGNVLDLGAQWITGLSPNNSVYNLATKLNIVKGKPDELDERSEDSGLLFYALRSQGIPITEKAFKMAEAIDYKILEEMNECYLWDVPHGGSIKDFYDEKAAECLNEIEGADSYLRVEVEEVLAGYFNVLRSFVGGEPKECSVDLFGTSIELPGGEIPVRGGVGQMVHRLVNSLPSHSLFLSSQVERIDWSNPDFICVSTKEHTFICDYVISSIPLGVLKARHESIFVPELGEPKSKAMSNFSAGQICKIFLDWDQPWWTPRFGGFALSRREKGDFVGDWTDHVGNFCRVKDHPSLLLTWVSGEYSSQVDELEDEKVIDGLMVLVQKYTGDPSIARASKVIRHRWNTDPHTLGGYSFPSIHSTAADIQILASSLPNEENPRILFAGEAACPNYWSYMHGARTSGLHSAEKIIRAIKNNNKF